MELTSKVGNKIKLSCICTDEKHGTWWAFATDKQWVEIRTTKAGKIKVFEVKKGTHPYFTPDLINNKGGN